MKNKTVTQIMTSDETMKLLTQGFESVQPSQQMIDWMKAKRPKRSRKSNKVSN